jgi:hypothetical protein
MEDAIERCDREIAEIQNRPDVQAGLFPAWLVTLGIEDWEAEKRAIHGIMPSFDPMYHTTSNDWKGAYAARTKRLPTDSRSAD